MTPRTVIALGAATVVMVAAAIVAVATQPRPVSIPRDRPLVFPDVGPGLNKVAEIEIQAARRTFTVKRTGASWRLAEVGGYPVRFEKVKTVLVQMAELRLLEPKTGDPARYARLEVEDVTAKDAKSKRVTIRDDKGKVLATGIIGKRNASLFGAGKGGTYLRRDDDRRAWLAEGIVALGDGPADWVAKRIVDLDPETVKSVVVRTPGGASLRVQRAKPGDKDFKLEPIPKGKAQRGQWETNQMPRTLESLDLEDLKPAGEVPFADGAYVSEFRTFDGLVVRTEAAVLGRKGKEEYWTRLSASAEGAKGENAEKVRKRAAEINARVAGTVYRVSESVGKRLTCKLENLLEGAGINACT